MSDNGMRTGEVHLLRLYSENWGSRKYKQPNGREDCVTQCRRCKTLFPTHQLVEKENIPYISIVYLFHILFP